MTIELKDGEWYWIVVPNTKVCIPAAYSKRWDHFVSKSVCYEATMVTIIRPLEDSPEAPLEDGHYWCKYTGKGNTPCVLIRRDGKWRWPYHDYPVLYPESVVPLNKIDGPKEE